MPVSPAGLAVPRPRAVPPSSLSFPSSSSCFSSGSRSGASRAVPTWAVPACPQGPKSRVRKCPKSERAALLKCLDKEREGAGAEQGWGSVAWGDLVALGDLLAQLLHWGLALSGMGASCCVTFLGL